MNSKIKSIKAKKQILVGLQHMAKSRVAICGLARDCKNALEKLAPALEQLGAKFKSYKIIVVENDSKDGTSEFLQNWQTENPNIHPIQFCTCPWVPNNEHRVQHWWFSKARMQRMNFARNLYLDALPNNETIDYVIVVDLDILSFSLPGIAHSFGSQEKWDYVASNGRRYSIKHPFRKEIYWDTYVYEPENGFPGGVLKHRDILEQQVRLSESLAANDLLRVKSAFGGLCIYKRQTLKNSRYHVIENNDEEVSVLCDHTTLHRSMAEAGYTGGFINANQTLRYESLFQLFRRLILKH